jgi:hypothetical protein
MKQNWFFEKRNKIDKSLGKLNKRKRRHKLIKLEVKRWLVELCKW